VVVAVKAKSVLKEPQKGYLGGKRDKSSKIT